VLWIRKINFCGISPANISTETRCWFKIFHHLRIASYLSGNRDNFPVVILSCPPGCSPSYNTGFKSARAAYIFIVSQAPTQWLNILHALFLLTYFSWLKRGAKLEFWIEGFGYLSLVRVPVSFLYKSLWLNWHPQTISSIEALQFSLFLQLCLIALLFAPKFCVNTKWLQTELLRSNPMQLHWAYRSNFRQNN
jgi:hypothetical protein